MKLGSLEFTPEDFVSVVHFIGDDDAEYIAARANRILREKLAAAPLIYCFGNPDYSDWTRRPPEKYLLKAPAARLVCIEEVPHG